MTSPFAPLAARISAAWSRARHEPRALAPIALEALATLDGDAVSSRMRASRALATAVRCETESISAHVPSWTKATT
jgi:hypothetical protein